MTRRRKVVGALMLVTIGLAVALVLAAVLFLTALNPVFLGVSDEVTGTIVSSGQKREYLLHVPRSYNRTRPTPLVISLHAAALLPAPQKETSRWNELADEHGFLVVYPSATRMAPVPFLPQLPVWRVESDERVRADSRFISELIDTLTSAYNIDSARIYANGLSNGGCMAFVLSCTLAQRIAAVGTVAAAQALPWSWCEDPRPVPMIAFHGTADRIVPYDGGATWIVRRPFPSVPAWTANWARRNRCGPNPIESAAAADVDRLEYTDCADNAAVVLYTVRGGGHSWPGGKPMPAWMVGPTSRSVDATRLMWAFFREHPLSTRDR